MANTVDAFETTSGTTFAKKEDSIGRTYYTKEGEGRVSKQSFMAGKSHTPEAEYRSRGHLQDIDDITDLGEPYDTPRYEPVEAYERGSVERAKAAERNRWYGFLMDEDTPDDPLEAFKQYADMKKELKEADTVEQEREIKRDFGVGDSG